MLTSANNSIFRGNTSNITIIASNKEYEIPFAVYNAALVHPPSKENTIVLTVDDNNYSNDESVGLIITFMHDIYIPNLPLSAFKLLTIDNRNLLPMYLSVYSWCNVMLREGNYYKLFLESLRDSIKLLVNLVRSLVCDDETLIDGKRFDILAKCGLPINIPTYLDKFVLLPQDPKYILIEECAKINVKQRNNYVFKSSSNRPYLYGKEGICDIYMYSDSSNKYFEEIDYDLQKLLDLQMRVRSDLIRSQMRIMCYEHPEYMKIDKFGDECTALVHNLLPNDSLLLYCKSKPKMTICDVFQYGLAAALTANYE